MSRELRDAALSYADRGWHVIPLRVKGKQPDGRLVPNGLKQATNDLGQVLRWWQPSLALHPHNIGIVCNPSGLVVVDVDPRHGGDETLAAAERAWGRLPTTVSAVTGGGGAHYVFNHPGCPMRGNLGQGSGVDIKDHGYIVAPPSLHPETGRCYEWDEHPDDTEIADLPAKWAAELAVAVRRPLERDPSTSSDPLRQIYAADYVNRITGREPDRRGFYQCPFHSGGQERTPSLKCDGHMWACYGCPATGGRRCAGGNIYDFMALYMDLPAPPKGADYLMVKDRLKRTFQ